MMYSDLFQIDFNQTPKWRSLCSLQFAAFEVTNNVIGKSPLMYLVSKTTQGMIDTS